jgi:hypothetical protein
MTSNESKTIARELLRSLRAGEISKIDIDGVRAAIGRAGYGNDVQFEISVMRAVVKLSSTLDHEESETAVMKAALTSGDPERTDVTDEERLNWLEREARRSRTGISFDWIPPIEDEPRGFRFMRRFFIGAAQNTLRGAIDAAMREKLDDATDRRI